MMRLVVAVLRRPRYAIPWRNVPFVALGLLAVDWFGPILAQVAA